MEQRSYTLKMVLNRMNQIDIQLDRLINERKILIQTVKQCTAIKQTKAKCSVCGHDTYYSRRLKKWRHKYRHKRDGKHAEECTRNKCGCKEARIDVQQINRG